MTKVLKDGTVLTFDDTAQSIRVLPKASILFENDRITAISEDPDFPVPQDAEIINVHGKIVTPGFVNTNIHTLQTVYRTIGPNVFLSQYFEWLGHISPATAAFTPDDVYISSLEGYLEGLHGEVTSYVEHAHNNWSADVVEPGFNAAVDSGARVWWCYDVADREGFEIKQQWEALGKIGDKVTEGSPVQLGLSVDGLSGLFGNDPDGHLGYMRDMVRKLNVQAITQASLGRSLAGSIPLQESDYGKIDGYLSESDLFRTPKFEIYSYRPRNALACVEHQRHEIAYRKRLHVEAKAAGQSTEAIPPLTPMAEKLPESRDRVGFCIFLASESFRAGFIGMQRKALGTGPQWIYFDRRNPSPWPARKIAPSDINLSTLQTTNLPIIYSHAPFLADSDQKALRENNHFISITPESEFHFGHGQTTGHLIIDQASLGLDTNWTFSGDMLSQTRLWLQNVRLTKPHRTLETGTLPRTNPFPVEEAFLMATRQGGRALRHDDIGVIKVGAKADLVVFNGDSPNMLGWSDPIAAVVLHANPGDIEHVLVDEEFRKRDFKLVDKVLAWGEGAGEVFGGF